MSETRIPTREDVSNIARVVLGGVPVRIERFTTGAANYVYDVETCNGKRAVVRIARNREDAAATLLWNQTLAPLGVPLPKLLGHGVKGTADAHAWVMLERLPGTDLGNVYASLTREQKLGILDRVIEAQQIVQALPHGRGFGFVNRPGETPHTSWAGVIREHLDISRQGIEQVGIVDPRHVERVAERAAELDTYFAAVAPVAFLHDTTTRNVIVHDGVFSGIVDVDSICYGDLLLVVALTRMALLADYSEAFYADAWLARVAPTSEQRRAFQFYTALFCVNFLSELGRQFNLPAPPPVNPLKLKRLTEILDMLLADL